MPVEVTLSEPVRRSESGGGVEGSVKVGKVPKPIFFKQSKIKGLKFPDI